MWCDLMITMVKMVTIDSHNVMFMELAILGSPSILPKEW